MDIATWVIAGAGLFGALIGAFAAVGGQSLEARRRAKAERAGELKSAIEEMLVASASVDLRGHEMMLLATNVGSINGIISRAVGNLVPLDFMAIFDRMNEDAKALERATARIWLLEEGGDLVARCNAVRLAAAEVVEAHQAPTTGKAINMARIALVGRHSKDVDRVRDARHKLALARRALGDAARKKLDLDPVDLFEVADPS